MWTWSLVHLLFNSRAELLQASWKESFSDCGSSTEGSEARQRLWMTAEHRVQHFLWEQHINNFLTFYPHSQKKEKNTNPEMLKTVNDQNESDPWGDPIHRLRPVNILFLCERCTTTRKSLTTNKAARIKHDHFTYYHLVSLTKTKGIQPNASALIVCGQLKPSVTQQGSGGESEAFPSRSQWGSIGGEKHRGA